MNAITTAAASLGLGLGLSAIAGLAEDDPSWPETLVVKCGDVEIGFEGPQRRWTLDHISFRGIEMAKGSGAYGTVFNFPDVGFIGTAHHENETEPVDGLEFYLDGKRQDSVSDALEGESFRLLRRSTIKAFALESEVELSDNRLRESATVKLPADAEAVPLKLVYHFMHPWHADSTHFLGGKGDEIVESGEFERDEAANRKFYINAEVDWIAVYNAATKTFAVSRLIEKPDDVASVSMIWNVHGAYRKFYLKCLNNAEVPSGFEGTWRMVTGFGEAQADSWQEAARKLAGKLAAPAG